MFEERRSPTVGVGGDLERSRMSNDTRVTVTLPFREVAWAKVLDLLVSRFRNDFFDADADLRRFFKSFHLLLNLRWFRSSRLHETDNSIAVAMCEVHSADTVVLVHDRPIQIGTIPFRYRLLLTLTPRLSRKEERETGRQSARIELTGFGRTIALTKTHHIALAQLLVIVVGILTYVVLCFMLLYGVSVLWQFHLSPAETIIAGTKRLDIGLALLAVFVGLAGIFGRAFSNVWRLVTMGDRTPEAIR